MTINVNINGKVCKLVVDCEEEKDFRDAGRMVSDLIGEYRNRFKSMPQEDLLTRVALDIAVNLVVKEREMAEIEELL